MLEQLKKEVYEVFARSSANNFATDATYKRISKNDSPGLAFTKIMTAGIPFELKDAIHEVTSAEVE